MKTSGKSVCVSLDAAGRSEKMKISFSFYTLGRRRITVSFNRALAVFNWLKSGEKHAPDRDTAISGVSLDGKLSGMQMLSGLLDYLADDENPSNEFPLFALVWKGFRANTIQLIDGEEGLKYGCTDVCCRIGESSFYFSDTTYNSIGEMFRDHGVIWAVRRITECLEDPEGNGLPHEESAVFLDIIRNGIQE